MNPICPDCDEALDSFEDVAEHRIRSHWSGDVIDGTPMPTTTEEKEELMSIIFQESASKHPQKWGVGQ